jgi:mono/diheme cytochrome c family protein
MRKFLVAVFVLALPLAHVAARAAQEGTAAPTGDPQAGRAVYTIGNTSCRNCHGTDGEGAFAPTLAGRQLSYERFRDYVRNPLGRMPGWVEAELTDQEILDLVAYFDSLPPPAEMAPWRTPLPDGAPRGQQLMVSTIGCGQCHGATITTPRHGAAEVTGDFEWFKRMVYDHPAAQREQWSQLEASGLSRTGDQALRPVTPGPAGPPGRDRVRMGSYLRARLPESTLEEIWDWMNELGVHLAALRGTVAAGETGPDGVTYTVTVTNAGVRERGVTMEGVEIALALPSGANVVRTTGEAEVGGGVATWRVASLPAADRQTFTITLGQAATELRGTITWAEPAVTSDPEVRFALPTGGRGGRGGE